MIYLLDTNAMSDILRRHLPTNERFEEELAKQSTLIVCSAVAFELRRGLLHKNALVQFSNLSTRVMPFLQWESVQDQDWAQAESLWVQAVAAGRQFSDVDLLLVALAGRLQATLVTADDDFTFFPIARENWRI